METRLCELYKSAEEYEIIERSVTFDILTNVIPKCQYSLCFVDSFLCLVLCCGDTCFGNSGMFFVRLFFSFYEVRG